MGTLNWFPIADWPQGLCREVAVLESPAVEALVARVGTFEQDFDDLDAFTAACFTAGGKAYAVQRHAHTPVPGYVLLALDEKVAALEQIDAFLQASGLSPESVIWRRSTD